MNIGNFSFLDKTIKISLEFSSFCMFVKVNNNKLSTFQTGKINENFHIYFLKLRSNSKIILLAGGAPAGASRAYIA